MNVSRAKGLAWLNLRKVGGLRKRELLLILSTVGPAIIYYLLLRYWPVLQTMLLSMTDAQLMSKSYEYIGIQNFIKIFSDPVFIKAIGNTTYYAFMTTILGTLLALILAFILNPIPHGNSLLRMLFFLPQITSAIAIATIW